MSEYLSPDVRRELYSDAVRLNKQQLWLAIPALAIVLMALFMAFFVVPRYMVRTVGAAVAVLVWIGRTGMEWRRLRQTDPNQYE